jgi:hypothetical protein
MDPIVGHPTLTANSDLRRPTGSAFIVNVQKVPDFLNALPAETRELRTLVFKKSPTY